jgi:hypothetical protein
MKKKARSNDKTSRIAAPVREFLTSAIRSRIKTADDRRALAEFLGQTPDSVKNLLRGEGGLDTWVAALVHCYGLDPKAMLDLIQNFKALMQKYKPSKSDQIATQIDLPEHKREALFSAVLTALRICQEK